MKIKKEKLKELLVRPGHIKEKVFDKCVKEAKQRGKSITDIILDKQLLNDEQMSEIMATYFKVPFVSLKNEKIDKELVKKIPELVATKKKVIAFGKDNAVVKLAMCDPNDLETVHFMEKFFQIKTKIYYISEQEFNYALSNYQSSLRDEFNKIFQIVNSKRTSREDKNKAVSRIVELLLKHSYYAKASDIHIEPQHTKAVVRFRIDGVLTEVLNFPKEILDIVLSRIKILSHLRIDEHQAAQDGKFRFGVNEEKFDVRVSIVPLTNGENVVMRLLFSREREIGLANLGMKHSDLNKINRAIKNPHGMILVTGPTGCGKSTTIYSILQMLNNEKVNISTIEDPVEYDMLGINQIQVNKKTNLSFAEGLRAIVRQDPDIIMVGEIRDTETADIAVNSAMTGHLVLSTLHANDAGTALPRLLDMNIEPFLVSSTVRVVIAQRLVRKICKKCRESHELDKEEILVIENNPYLKHALKKRSKDNWRKQMFFRGSGCSLCADTGYQGRVGIFEIMEINNSIKNLILKRAPGDQIGETAMREGMTTMFEDGLDKVFNGITTLTEVLRVADVNI